MSNGSEAGRREIAYRPFAAEFDDADLSYSEGDEERAPNYVITPTGARINRLFAVGVLTEVEHVNEEMVRARVVDPTGAFVVYAGQYQPDALAFLERAAPPMFVAVTGKARTFQPEDSDRVFTSVRPESVNEVDADTRDRWTVQAAEHTLDRVATFAEALGMDRGGADLREALVSRGVDEGLATGIPRALSHYGTTPAYLEAVREMAIGALRVVAGDRDEVEPPGLAPDEGGPADLEALQGPAVSGGEPASAGAAGATAGHREPGEPDAVSGDRGGDETDPGTATASTARDRGRSASGAGDEPVDATAPAEPPRGTQEADTSEPSDVEPGPGGEDESDQATPAEGGGEIGDFEPGEFDLEDDERDRIESEYGTEFETGSEVDEPGEADIGVGEPADEGPAPDTGGAIPDTETAEGADSDRGAPSGGGDVEPGAEGTVDLEDAAVDAMYELDEGDGADREAVVERVTERSGASRDAVTAAIQDALMDGRCYEPDDETLKPI